MQGNSRLRSTPLAPCCTPYGPFRGIFVPCTISSYLYVMYLISLLATVTGRDKHDTSNIYVSVYVYTWCVCMCSNYDQLAVCPVAITIVIVYV